MENLDRGLELLFARTQSSAFSHQAVENIRRTSIVKIRQRYSNPAELANEWFARTVYGDTVYGRSLIGSEASLSNISHQDVTDFHRAHFDFQNMVLIGVGAFRADKLRSRLESLLPATPYGATTRNPTIDPPVFTSTQVCLVDFPQAAQTEIRIGHSSVASDCPEFARLQVLSRILDRRLNLNLRERRGKCYQVRSRFAARSGPGPFVTAAGVANDSVGTVVTEVVREIERLQRELIPEQEIYSARNHLAGDYLRSFQTNHGPVVELKRAALNNLPDSHIEQYLADINGADQETLLLLARRYLRYEGIAVVAVGSIPDLRRQLRGCGRIMEVAPAEAKTKPRGC